MDASVIAAIARWPNVPAVFGWLSLNERGDWRLRGEPIHNPAIRDFIGRNYASDDRGCWFFQNGPQRVYVELESTPWIWRVDLRAAGDGLLSHTGVAVRHLNAAYFGEDGRCYLDTDLGFGLVESSSLERIERCLVAPDGQLDDEAVARWLDGAPLRIVLNGGRLALERDVALERLRAAEIPARFGFVRVPQPD
jgi:hypothetical protein